MNSNYPLFWINENLTNGFVEYILYIFLIIVFLIEIYCIIANLIKFVIIYINRKTTKIIILIENWLKKSNSLFAYFIMSLYLLFYLYISLNFVLYFRIIILGFISIKNMEINTLIFFIDYISEMIANIIDSITLKMDGTDSDSNPLSHVYEFASKSSKPKEVEKAIPELPKNVPKYPGKVVESVPTTSVVEKRGLSPMRVEMPSNTSNPTHIERINILLGDIKKSIELYDNQAIKFRKHISDIDNNTELWYHPKSKELFKEYIKVVDALKCQQKELGNQAIDELKNLDPNTKHKYFK